MQIYPAIDLKDEKCVRLLRGDMEAATIFNDSPLNQAQQFADMGTDWLHIVDLNGAFKGKNINHAAVSSIIAGTDLKIQIGGGIRTMSQIDQWLDQGIARIILGTAAIKNPDFLRAAAIKYPQKIALGLDSLNGKVAVSGWAEITDIALLDLAASFQDLPLAAIIHTDIAKDGAMEGVNLASTKALADTQKIPVIASGGVRDMADIEALSSLDNLDGVIIGRALYDGTIDLKVALQQVLNA